MILLASELIYKHLELSEIHEPITLHVFDSIDSTNLFLKTIPASPGISICCAETQTQGHGRFGRSWHSPYGENIYCSSVWSIDCKPSQLSSLSLIVSLAVIATLRDAGVPDVVRIKWPNDLLWKGKKLCGILIETIKKQQDRFSVVIGIGLNVNSATENHPILDKPWCSLYEITQRQFDRNALIAQLIAHLHDYLNTFMMYGFSAFERDWHTMDYLYGKSITVSQLSVILHGKAGGVTETGQLILIDEYEERHYLSSGDTTLTLPSL